MIRIRITYAKTEALRYTSNLDVHKILERTFRRAHLPLVYSLGFNPQPRLNQACPLPLGITSRAEVLDAWLEEERFDAQHIKTSLQNTSPPGIELRKIDQVELASPPLQAGVVATEYQAVVSEVAFTELRRQIHALLETQSLRRQRRGKEYDLRPLILALTCQALETANRSQVWMLLEARQGATGRPDEVLLALGLQPAQAQLERLRIIFTPSQSAAVMIESTSHDTYGSL